MKLDHIYLIAKNLKQSTEIYTKILGRSPDTIEGNQWVDWHKDGVYFGLMCEQEWKRTGGKNIRGRSPVLVLKSKNLAKDAELIKSLNLKIITPPKKVNGLEYDYTFFEFEDPNGYILEVAMYG